MKYDLNNLPKLGEDQIYRVTLDCGHVLETVDFSKKEKESSQIFCPAETLIKPAEIVSIRVVKFQISKSKRMQE